MSDKNENTAELKQPHEEWQEQSVGDVRSEMACEGFDTGDGRREEGKRGERSKAKRIKQPGLSNSVGRVDRVSVFGDAERSGGSCRDGGGGKQKSRWRLL